MKQTRPVPVATSEQARQVLREAQPGDVIYFAPGVYCLKGEQIAGLHLVGTGPINLKQEPKA